MKKMAMPVGRQGFTLIEIVVVTAAIAIIMVAIIGVVVSSFKLQNQTKSNSKVVSSGNEILNELKKNILNSNREKISCAENGLSVSLINTYDGKLTTISCGGGNIASSSAQTVYLNNREITVINCTNFVTCSTLPSLEISDVKFKFGVRAITSGVGITQNFEVNITVRN